ncbi:uncharacterized protein C11orf24-like [Oxyura jamaicensis]|uniref:uncharacterized protein C11orf24-like n=1 Tax=Oxyura jamaicensis TaxID=8884 RepID=UPI0015A5B651|nr:uncharacterized protein C11orf24-like [Oxyura jamaicensis]XP_035184053.1 uncharacterized protein C11orf24-like [Oxyura jamaicensis]XP_035184054.1 uncharacterized protein C11orf24-like [Oxyura jamaicensis]XP_035184055.1 uncharacterized protein C11orf24-like [Oxyura jamaicensis]XP_035184056.1 uncharacterized protein C11orf24-like [Oxyura jamaicensis]XP_035184057.1 uncharacterized protein C11orf24-like [Oxyura jamaicensis]XP_035184058.1 uncharacterized protein C11orf24-like [Oxyura jamaicensi
MWTAIVFFLLISFCICESRFPVLKGRGVRVVQINRLKTEKQCRQACKGSAASGNHHCNWSVPYQDRCILLQCHQLRVCQNAGEQEIKDLLGEIIFGERETVQFHHKSYPQTTKRMVKAQTEQYNRENLFFSTIRAHKIYLRQLAVTAGYPEAPNTGKTASSVTTSTTITTVSATTVVTMAGTSATVHSAANEITAKASNALGVLLPTTMSSIVPSPTPNDTASTSRSITKLLTTAEKLGNDSFGSVSAPSSAPVTATTGADTQMNHTEQFSTATNTTSTSHPSSLTTAGAGPKKTSTTSTTLTQQDAVISSTASSRAATTFSPSVSPHSANSALPMLPETSRAPTSSSESTSSQGSTRGAMGLTSGPAAETTTGHGTKSVSLTPSIEHTTTTPANAPGTTTLNTAKTKDTNNEYLLIAAEPLTQYLVDKSSLLAVLLFGTFFFITVIVLFLMQAYESYKKKDYTQVDYLINGMYVDSEM